MRMSASSSTIRMSCAMSNRTHISRCRRRTANGAAVLGHEYQPDACPARFGIFQQQLALMILHDLLDDGEAQAGALGARRHVGLGQSLAVALRQALSIVPDRPARPAGSLLHRYSDLPRRVRAGIDKTPLDRLDGVLDDV